MAGVGQSWQNGLLLLLLLLVVVELHRHSWEGGACLQQLLQLGAALGHRRAGPAVHVVHVHHVACLLADAAVRSLRRQHPLPLALPLLLPLLLWLRALRRRLHLPGPAALAGGCSCSAVREVEEGVAVPGLETQHRGVVRARGLLLGVKQLCMGGEGRVMMRVSK